MLVGGDSLRPGPGPDSEVFGTAVDGRWEGGTLSVFPFVSLRDVPPEVVVPPGRGGRRRR